MKQRRPSDTESYVLAGWVAIASAVLVLPELFVTFLYEVRPGVFGLMGPIGGILSFLKTGLSICAFWRFKTFLNSRYQFHKVDGLVIALIIGGIVLTLTVNGARAISVVNPDFKIIGILMIIVVGIPLAVLGIVFGIKLLGLDASMGGLLKPLAYIYIIASACFATLILAPIGLLLGAAFDLLLGILFLRGIETIEEKELEYV